MSDNLDRFIKQNRSHFDEEQPSEKLWEQIEKGLQSKTPVPVRSLKQRWWTAAAAVILFATAATAYIIFKKTDPVNQPVVENNTIILPDNKVAKDADIAAIDPVYAQQAARFSLLIDEKQKELKAIQTDEPFLYKKFSFDIKRLDSTYTLLKQQLPVNPNKEELLEAMIYNLQLQIELLNQQLNIIQKIKQSKSTSL
ncbi:hypothetical protein [Agriterribacter humi]|jgi:hypothetical protein|uniref:hypothetical protein n=1 Tax=Agriterribacter humi TaxID=1104781 RepID=UPI001264D721|nr:hypothetical protein [Agriterribacter humi]